MNDPRDFRVDISSMAPLGTKSPGAPGRPFVSVLFACCRVYQRIYRSADGTRYAGRCPKCGRPIRFLVGKGGTSERSFVVE